MPGMNGAPLTTLLLAATVVASLLALRQGSTLIDRWIFRPHFLVPGGQWHTVVTSALIHADLPHLAFNMITLWAFGVGLEQRVGSLRLGLLYAVGLAASAAGTWLRHRAEPGYRSLGASGAISAVLFAAIVYQPGSSIYMLPIPVPIPAPLFALLYLGYSQWAARRAHGNINHDAHLAGALAGLVFVGLTDLAAFGQALRQLLA